MSLNRYRDGRILRDALLRSEVMPFEGTRTNSVGLNLECKIGSDEYVFAIMSTYINDFGNGCIKVGFEL